MRFPTFLAVLALALAVGVTSFFGSLSASSAYEVAHQVRRSIPREDVALRKALPTDMQGYANLLSAETPAFPTFGH